MLTVKILCQSIHAIVSCADRIGVLDQDVHCDEGTNAADEITNDTPQNDRRTVLLEGHVIAGCVGAEAVGQLVIPEICVKTTGNEGKQNECNQTGGILSVALAGDVYVSCHGVQEIITVKTTGDDGQYNVSDQASVGLKGAACGGHSLTAEIPAQVVDGTVQGLASLIKRTLCKVSSIVGRFSHFCAGADGRSTVGAVVATFWNL